MQQYVKVRCIFLKLRNVFLRLLIVLSKMI